MNFSYNFTIRSKRFAFVIFSFLGCVTALLTLALLYSLLQGGSTSVGSLVTGLIFLLILTALFLWGADSSSRVMTCQDGVLTETRGRFFKRRTTVFDLQATDRIQAFFVSVRGIDHSYIQLFGQGKTIILGPMYYTKKGRLHILTAIHPLLQNPAIKKEGDFDRALKQYYSKYHPSFDRTTNVIHVDQPPLEI